MKSKDHVFNLPVFFSFFLFLFFLPSLSFVAVPPPGAQHSITVCGSHVTYGTNVCLCRVVNTPILTERQVTYAHHYAAGSFQNMLHSIIVVPSKKTSCYYMYLPTVLRTLFMHPEATLCLCHRAAYRYYSSD